MICKKAEIIVKHIINCWLMSNYSYLLVFVNIEISLSGWRFKLGSFLRNAQWAGSKLGQRGPEWTRVDLQGFCLQKLSVSSGRTTQADMPEGKMAALLLADSSWLPQLFMGWLFSSAFKALGTNQRRSTNAWARLSSQHASKHRLVWGDEGW